MALNYFDIPAIQRETSRVPRAGSESVLYGVWNTILTWQFPVQQGYVTRPQDRHTSQAGQRGFSDLHTFQYPSAQQRANKFLIVQCKRTGLETRASTWGEVCNNSINIFLQPTAPGMSTERRVRDIGDPTVPSTAGRLHLKNDRIAIQQILDHIKANH
ncbi:hypothetical protein N7460_013169 [Penicillium canescens]|uniref:Uncharacterized protein n=1 Tax=Penicillium canescens TaxID=5083 RepID=A0AAD6HYF2_PENCN|nr:hypothetical protein N7460_013169 [Penicillium canescens]